MRNEKFNFLLVLFIYYVERTTTTHWSPVKFFFVNSFFSELWNFKISVLLDETQFSWIIHSSDPKIFLVYKANYFHFCYVHFFLNILFNSSFARVNRSENEVLCAVAVAMHLCAYTFIAIETRVNLYNHKYIIK